jgi:hypothetical protein
LTGWTLSGTIPREEIEPQFQGLDRGEFGRREWQRLIAREKATEDMEGQEENGIGNLG